MAAMCRLLGFLSLCAILLPSPLQAQDANSLQVVTSSAAYVMADSDTWSAAEQAVLRRAQARAVEEAGVYLESLFKDTTFATSTQARQSSSLMIRTLGAAILKTDILERAVTLEQGRPTFSVRIRATVDMSQLVRAVEVLHREDQLSDRFDRLSTENTALRSELRRLRRTLDHSLSRSTVRPLESSTELLQQALHTGNWLERIALTTQALAINPREQQAWIVRGQTLLRIASLPHSPDPNIEDRTWLLEHAAADFSKAMSVGSPNPWAWFGAAEVLNLQRRLAEAIPLYRQLLDIDPLFDIGRERMAVAAITQATAHMGKGEWDAALQVMDQLLGDTPLPSWVPDQAKAYLLRSRIQVALHRPELAVKDLSILIDALPQHREARFQRGEIYRQIGDLERSSADRLVACELGKREACRRTSS